MSATQGQDPGRQHPVQWEDGPTPVAPADLELAEVLARIVAAAADLVDAHYGALGVLDGDGVGLAEFVTHGISADERAAIGHVPRGLGVLGLLIREPLPVRVDDITAHPDSVGFPPGHPPMRTFLGVPVRLQDSVFGNLYLAEKRSGGPFTPGDEAVVVGLASVAGLAIENARLLQRSREQGAWLEISAELTRRLLQGIPEPDALAWLADRIRVHVRSATAAVVLDDADGQPRLVATSPASTDPPVEAGGAPTPDGAPPTDDTSPPGGEQPPAGASNPASGPPTVSAPITVGTQRIGVLSLSWPEGRGTQAETAAEVLAQLAAQTGLALTASRAQADRSRLAVVEDRDRIARDMHDHVIQRLFATGLSLQAAGRFATHPLVLERLEEAVDSLDIAIRDIRQTIFELHRTRAASDFRSDLAQVVSDAEAGLGFAAVLRVSEHLDGLGSALEADILAVVREGLTNVARHAQARSAEVTVQRADGEVMVEVRDDGRGIGERDERRSGLANLADRATARRGQLRTGPADGGGTTLLWRAPVPLR